MENLPVLHRDELDRTKPWTASTGQSDAKRLARVARVSADLDALRSGQLKALGPPTCLDLNERFPKYRKRPSQDHVPGGPVDPWNLEIPCSRHKATIYPHGRHLLQARIEARCTSTVAAQLEQAGCVPFQRGGGEATFVFDVADFDAVAAVLRPIRKRKGNQAHFHGAKGARSQGTLRAQEGTIASPGDGGDTPRS